MDKIRAWKDPEYRASSDHHSGIEHPSGLIELPESDCVGIGGGKTERAVTFGCCGGFFGETGYRCIDTAYPYDGKPACQQLRQILFDIAIF